MTKLKMATIELNMQNIEKLLPADIMAEFITNKNIIKSITIQKNPTSGVPELQITYAPASGNLGDCGHNYETIVCNNGGYYIGEKGISATGKYSFATGGKDCRAEGDYSVAMGNSCVTYPTANYSVAMGNGCETRGISSVAMGRSTYAKGDYSVALGQNSVAHGDYSFAIGQNSVAHGDYSFAMGDPGSNNNQPSISYGEGSVVMGGSNTANGAWSVAMGGNNTTESKADRSLAMGFGNTANGHASVAIGDHCTTMNPGEFACGAYNKTETGQLFSIGNGTSDSDRKNVFGVYQTGGEYLYRAMVYEKGFDNPKSTIIRFVRTPGSQTHCDIIAAAT